MVNEKQTVFLVVIADRKKKEELLRLLLQRGAKLINTIYARGSVNASSIKEVFGFITEEHKVIITALLLQNTSNELLDDLIDRHNFNKPNTGIAFTIPVEGLSY